MLPRLRNPLGGRHDLAVDLGTANTVVYKRGEGIVIFEPSVVAIDEETGTVQAIGESAKRMIGRTPASIRATRPLRHGVIADFEITEEMLRYFIRKAADRRSSPRVIVCVPSGITEVERRAVEEATLAAGARRAYLIEEPMAGAIGAGLPVSEAYGNLIVDIGGGTSEMAVIALGGMAVSESLRVGGYELDDAIVRHAQQHHKLLIGQQQAERVKLEIGSAWPMDDMLERTPPELAADLGDRGVVLVGGGALLRGIDERIARETHLAVSVAESPLLCVALGAGQSLDEVSVLERVRKTAP